MLEPLGRSVPGGRISSVGVGGLTIGGWSFSFSPCCFISVSAEAFPGLVG